LVSLFVLWAVLVSTFVAVTVTPGTTAPEASVIEPLISADVACASQRKLINATNTKKHAVFNTSALLVFIPRGNAEFSAPITLYRKKLKLQSFIEMSFKI
jgi:hypothetical protein